MVGINICMSGLLATYTLFRYYAIVIIKLMVTVAKGGNTVPASILYLLNENIASLLGSNQKVLQTWHRI